MKKNIGIPDRAIRLPLGIIVVVYFFNTEAPGLTKDIGLLAGVLLILTAIIGICPFYSIIGVDTNKKRNHRPNI